MAYTVGGAAIAGGTALAIGSKMQGDEEDDVLAVAGALTVGATLGTSPRRDARRVYSEVMASTPSGSRGPHDEGASGTRVDEREREVAHAQTLTPPVLGPTSETSDLGGNWSRRDGETTSRDIPAGTMVGDYKIEGKLGEGGMGAVYSAVHPMIGKLAAIKVIKPDVSQNAEAVERFVQEARAVNQIGHPNIVDVFAFGSLPDGRSYFAMEWLKGESLRERLARSRLQIDEIVHILDRVIRGLEAAHDKKIIHRDLKPDNVFLVEVKGERPLVKLLDFGIAKLGGNADQRLERTRTGAMMGTPMYISPEQARGYQVDHRADIYSLGVMAFEMFTGDIPFESDNAMDMIAQHLSAPPPVPSTREPGLSREVDELLLSMMDKEPARRPSLQRVRETLERIKNAPAMVAAAQTIPETSLPPAVLEARRETQRGRRRVAVVGAAVVAVAAAGVIVVASGGGGSGRGNRAAEKEPETVASGGGSGGEVASAVTPQIGGAVVETPVVAIDAAVAVDEKPAMANLVVEVIGASDATVEVDGTVVLRSGKRAKTSVTRGVHEVVVMARGRKPETRTVDLSSGDTLLEVPMERVKTASGGGGSGGRGVAGGGGSAKGSATGTGASVGSGSAKGSAQVDNDALVDPFKRKKPPQ